ncbi:hypothetical protein VZT92_015312 [Zoarces viviparus]|uniref:Uncharacterized protein n=1 Tax=Zoarces viviparus TaxID=48416 RepID=A0AAW1EWN2_ZOAVI
MAGPARVAAVARCSPGIKRERVEVREEERPQRPEESGLVERGDTQGSEKGTIWGGCDVNKAQVIPLEREQTLAQWEPSWSARGPPRLLHPT